jgi:hypothetical protein
MICSTVQILGTGISQIENNRVVNMVPKEEILYIKLSHDSRSHRPFLRFLAGFVLMATGMILLLAEFIIAEGRIISLQLKSFTFGLPFIPILLWSMVGVGAWLLIGVFRGRYNFLIETKKGIQKIFFDESTDIREIRDFIIRAKDELGYDIDVTLFDSMHF